MVESLKAEDVIRSLERELLRAPVRLNLESLAENTSPILFLYQPSGKESREERKLVEAMISAMKLEPGAWELKVIEKKASWNSVASGNSSMIIQFGKIDATGGPKYVANEWSHIEQKEILQTTHPKDLLRNPAEKKEVWAKLQEALVKHLN